MFRQLAREYEKVETPPEREFPLPQSEDGVGVPLPADRNRRHKFAELFLYHPIQLAGLLEAAWEGRFRPTVGDGNTVSPITALPEPLLNALNRVSARPFESLSSANPGVPPFKLSKKVRFDHLIYAYMIENTRIYDIFHRVLYHFLTGEMLQVPSPASHRWLRNTEELFYRDPPPFFAFQLTSYVRPDIRASRRNAYYRMFGMDLNHGTDDGRPQPYEKAAAANRDFVPTFEAFLQEVWRGIINARNTIGPNTTDDAAIANLAGRLSDMLKDRQENGNLVREAFFYVAAMSWLHLTVEFDSPIVLDLKADGSGPSERLRAIGERVGIPAHGRAYDLFNLADPMSRIMIAIESGSLSQSQNVPLLYRLRDTPPPLPATPLRDDITTIITNWSSATGRNMKAEPVTASPNGAVSPATVSADGRASTLVPST